jgi:uncharacterized protein YfaS (alpha-2-macroglobulin family)
MSRIKISKVFLRIMAPVLIGGAVFLSCGRPEAPDSRYVTAFTGGIILRSDPVEVVFARARDTSISLPEGSVRLKPAVGGTLSWKDEYTLVFTPSSLLKGDTEYTVTVDEKKPELKPFSFRFKTQPPLLEVTVDPVRIDGSGDILVEGFVVVDRGTPPEEIEKIVGSSELGEAEWTHEDGSHRFRFRPVKMEEGIRTAAITWSGRSLGSREEGFTTVRIPGSSAFEMVELRQNEGILEVAFSAPIKSYPDLRGFVSLSGNTDVRYSLEGNIVRIFGSQGGAEGIPPGTELLIQDLEDINGNVLLEPVQYRVPDKWELPQVRFTGRGVILPTSQGSAMVIETRNLSGLLVEAFEVYGANMVQFLQVNPLSGERELSRVGEPVWTKAIDFDWEASEKNLWVRRGLDLSELAAAHPGSLFRLRLSFRLRHVKYECTLNHGDYSNLDFPDDTFSAYSGSQNQEDSYWDYYQQSPGYSWYDWYQKRLDPCHPAFYMPFGDHNITVGRNVLVSDLGLLAKRSLDGSWVAAASNLKTAKPAAGAEIRLLNYQGRLLYQTRTGADGIAVIPDTKSLTPPGTPALLSALTDFGTAWLKIDDSMALASSHFDVSGEKPADGIRGLIYGERGVWRPGDNIYLTFLLSDPAGTLPPEHPVSFELQDPRGRITMQRTYTSPVDGFYPIAAATASDAPTGDWNARVRVGGSVFNKNIKIETVMPNRLKMDLDFGPGPYIEAGITPASLTAEWLYGAPAPGLKADISVSLADKETSFPAYGDYSFRDPSRQVSFERQTVWEGTLDDAGKAAFNMELNGGSSAPGKMNARFMTRVFEPSGVFSSEQVSLDFSPYKRYVGIKLPKGDAARNMLLTDTDHQADIVVLDGEGKPVQGEVSLDCAVYQLSWRWWWEKGSAEAAEFASTLSRSPVVRGKAVSQNGKASWKFNVKYPDWGRYLVIARDAAGGHAAASVVYIDWPGWAGRAQEGGQGSQAMLVLSAEKPNYLAGETVSLSFPSNKEAAALVMVEKGGRIIRREWVPCGDGTTRYSFGAEPSMVPNVYVHVTMLQPHLQTQNDLPMRLYGIIPVMVEDPRTKISPRITVPDNWQPESRVSFAVHEAEGRPMVYTAAVVDEGLLGLTRYSLPNPRNTFYAREASFLKSWDLYSDIMGAFSGRLETLLAIGGGDDSIDDTSKETQRFKPVVRFFGPYELKPGETRTEAFDLPPYTGALRVMVMAASSTKEAQPASGRSQRAYGAAEKAVKVSSDLMVFGSLPRILSPGDLAEIPVTVSSYKEGARNVRVSLAAPGAAISGQALQNISFDKAGEKTIRFTVRAPDLPGTLRFSISAESPGLRAASHQVDMEVRSTSVPVTRSLQYLIGAGETWRGNLEFPGRPGSNSGVIELSRLPPLNLEKRLEYLVSYPHGCVEQTTSAVFPQLYLNRILDLEPEKAAEIRRNIEAGIERLAGFQTASGGFAYWPGNGFANDWGTTYAGHFLAEARRAGYEVPENIIKSWLYFQKDQARLWQARSNTYTEQAYRLYTIALAGEADLGSMNRLREQKNLEPRAAWRLAAAYWYAGQRDTARNMVKDLAIPSSDYRELSGTFGSGFRDKAMILETLILMEEPGRTRPLFEELSSVLSADNWLSTQETACALIAMAPYMEGVKASGSVNLDCTLVNNTRSVSFDSPVTRLDMGGLPGTAGAFSLANRSPFPVYARVTAKGLPEEGSEPPLSEGLSLSVEYRDTIEGRIIDPDALKPGEDMEVRVKVRNSYSQKVSEIALVHPIPASWELVNFRLGEGGASSPFKYQDIRDDRVMTYFDLNRGEEKTVQFRVNKTYGGSYFRPAIHAYAMYDESIRALVPGVKYK